MAIFRSACVFNNSLSISRIRLLTWRHTKFCMVNTLDNSEFQNHDSHCSNSVKIEFKCRKNRGPVSVLYILQIHMQVCFKLHDLREWSTVCECVCLWVYVCLTEEGVRSGSTSLQHFNIGFFLIFCPELHGAFMLMDFSFCSNKSLIIKFNSFLNYYIMPGVTS